MPWQRYSSKFLPVSSFAIFWFAYFRPSRHGMRQAPQRLADQPFHVAPQRLRLHAIKTLTGKSGQQQLARRDLVDPARAQIEQRVLFNLSYGGAVRTFHVVGVDLQLR